MKAAIVALGMGLGMGALPSSATSTPRHHEPCAGPGRTVLRSNAEVRVFTSASSSSVSACARRSGKVTPLYSDDPTSDDSGRIRALAGHFVVYDVIYAEDDSCRADCPAGSGAGFSETNLVDARTGAERELEAPARAVALARSGSVAWLVGDRPRVRLMSLRGRRRQTLDTGDVRTLRLRRGVLHWVAAGRPRSTPFP